MLPYKETQIWDLPGCQAGRLLHKRAAVALPAVAFGCDTESLTLRGKIEAVQKWGPGSFTAAEVRCWTIEGAVLHGLSGIVTVDNCVIKQSLLHAPFTPDRCKRIGDTIELPASKRAKRIVNGWHAASGSYNNYYHWMLDILPNVQIRPLGTEENVGALLMPPAPLAFQRQTVAVLGSFGYDFVHLDVDETVEVEKLAFVPNMTGAGFAPHPGLITFFDRLAEAIRPRKLQSRKLYISRIGAKRRTLRNEAEVIDLLRQAGYEICDTATCSFKEQVELFASATHIVAPHGAGLVNTVFCRPGTQLLELQMDAYMNLCFRKMAALKGIVYGCVVGDSDHENSQKGKPQMMEWSVDLGSLRRALGQMQ